LSPEILLLKEVRHIVSGRAHTDTRWRLCRATGLPRWASIRFRAPWRCHPHARR